MRRTSIRLLATLLVSGVFAACSGDSSKRPDFGGDEDVLQDLGPEVAADPGADPGTDPGEEPDAPEDPGLPSDPGGDVGPVRCVINQDCADVPMELGECRRKVCLKPENVCGQEWDPTCCFDGEFFIDGFEAGMGGWTVDDPEKTDKVTWSVTTNRKAAGEKSLYFGDPVCRTFYTGPLDANCNPMDRAGGAGRTVRASVTSPFIEIPPLASGTTTFAVSMFVWLDTEPFLAGLEAQPDVLRLQAVPKEGGIEDVRDLYSSVSMGRNTDGNFLYVVANIGEYAGSEVAFRLLFDSFDPQQNHFEGVYVDQFRVFTTCAGTCTAGVACSDDGDACSDDACQEFSNQDGVGVCAHPTVPSCLVPVCTSATVEDDCPNTDPCREVSCPNGACIYAVIPEEECCRYETLMAVGFDAGELAEFDLWAYQDNQKVKWQLSSQRATSGDNALYYGNLAALNYVSQGSASNFGEATSPAVSLPERGYYFLTFNTFISTEFDLVSSDDYMNPLGVDFFEVIIVEDPNGENPVKTHVWSSHYVHGTTQGAFIPVGVDLSAWAGKTVSVRFRFDTSDNLDNGFEGIYVDDLVLTRDTCVRRDCAGNQDCLIDGVCRTGACTDHVCDVTVVGEPPDCCASVVQCDDGDACTADACVAHACAHEPFEGPGCCLEWQVKGYAFDGAEPLDGFTVIDEGTPGAGGAVTTWAASDVRFVSSPRSLRFGNAINFDNKGVAKGKVLTPAFSIPSAGNYELRFDGFFDIESGPERDLFHVDVVDGDVATPLLDKSAIPLGNYGAWYEVGPVSLDAFRGKSIRLQFRFNSVDGTGNDGQGVFIDDVSVRKVCP